MLRRSLMALIMEKPKVAVIGTGSSGLTMMKQLREDGFRVTAFERRDQVGGAWAYSPNTAHTTALPSTLSNISKFVCGFSDYPMPDDYPPYLSQAQFQQFMQDYAEHFDLLKDIRFSHSLKSVTRNKDDNKWLLEFEEHPGATQEFDKVAFCHGYQTERRMPKFEGQELFEGTIIHAQQYRSPEPFKNKRVVVLGLSASIGDIVPDLYPHAAKIYVSHRSGGLPFKRFRNGRPADSIVTWRRRMMGQLLQRYTPRLAKFLADTALKFMIPRIWSFPLDPDWRLTPVPSVTLHPIGGFEFVMPLLHEGGVTSVHGIKRYIGPKSIELGNGTILEDIDAVICATGYIGDFGPVSSFLSTSLPDSHGYASTARPNGENPRPLARLWMNLFPPQYADSIALLCYSALGKSNGFSFSDITAMAVSNAWRGVEPFPSRPEMEKWIDNHHEWVTSRWAMDHRIDTSMVKQWEFQGWLHQAAGTGMESLGWGWKGWKFWWEDRKMYNLMNNGLETAHMYRFFETGKRKTWEGARQAIIHANDLVKTQLPVNEEEQERMLGKYYVSKARAA